MFYKIIGFYEWGKGAPHLTAVMRAIVKIFFMNEQGRWLDRLPAHHIAGMRGFFYQV
jgi:hypothetical protein